MKRLWPKVKTSTVIYYILAITALSIIANLLYQGDVSSNKELSAEVIGKTAVEEVKSVEISMENVLYQLPPNQYPKVLTLIGSLKATDSLSKEDEATTTCIVQVRVKDDKIFTLLAKKKNDQTPDVVFIEMEEGNRNKVFGSSYLAEGVCAKMLNITQ